MNAFILAAGFGTRLRPLTDRTPKPLVPVLNVPSICYTLFLLSEAGFGKAIVNIHHHPESIRGFFERHNFGGMEIVLSEEKTILGTGGGLKKCEHLLDDGDFLLINSDIISDIDLKALIGHHRKSGLGGTLALHETPLAAEIGQVGIRDGRVLDFRNMRGTGLLSPLIYTGTAVLSPNIFRYLSDQFSSIVDTGFTGLIDHEGLGYYEHRGIWQDIGTLQNFYRTNLDGNLRILQLEPRMNRCIGISPRMVSSLAEISPGALVSQSVVGDRCSIAAGAVVEHSVLLPDTIVERGSVIRNAIAGPGWIVPA
ncbi:MAG: NDP-sugar synthase [Chlorobiaceae bacterium]|nr:NDP-sugar synthase [Chlorobiaceae bacterium]NTW73740.1 NDP-sugar synthase [Chlorobiaceae bacterium]